jgi:hypothetical protein
MGGGLGSLRVLLRDTLPMISRRTEPPVPWTSSSSEPCSPSVSCSRNQLSSWASKSGPLSQRGKTPVTESTISGRVKKRSAQRSGMATKTALSFAGSTRSGTG